MEPFMFQAYIASYCRGHPASAETWMRYELPSGEPGRNCAP
jgi:hypothetical protein